MLRKKMNVMVNIFIILLTIAPAFALGVGNKNLLLIGAMCLSPHFIFRYPIIVPKIDLPLVGVCFMMICWSLLFYPDTIRWSTILYSCLFCLNFMAFARILYNSDYKITDFEQIIRWLLYAFCIVLMIQQFCVLTGLPIFNISNYNPIEPWKLNSLTAEPSHTARAISLLMYIYLGIIARIYNTSNIKELFPKIDKRVFIAYLYPIISMGSVTAFLFLILLLVRFIPKKQIIPLIIGVTIVCLSFFVIFKDNSSFNRLIRFTTSILSFDESQIIETDLSAAIRIIPTIHGGKVVDLNTINGFFGHGVDADEGLTPLPTVDCGAGAFSLWYNYGAIVAFSFWIFSFYTCYSKNDKIMSSIFWILLCFSYGGINNQMIWFTLALFLTYKYTCNKKTWGLFR